MVLLQLYREHEWFLNCGKQEQVENLPLGYKSRHWQRVVVRNKNKTKKVSLFSLNQSHKHKGRTVKGRKIKSVCPQTGLNLLVVRGLENKRNHQSKPTHYTNTFYLEIPIVRCTNTFCSPISRSHNFK